MKRPTEAKILRKLLKLVEELGKPDLVAFYEEGEYDGEAKYRGDGGAIIDITHNVIAGNTVILTWDDGTERKI